METSANSHGRIASGVAANAAALKTLDFVEQHLGGWRDDPDRPPATRERDLNSQLCKYLNVAARRNDFAMFHFHHEEPQGVFHSTDISVNPVDTDWIEGRPFSKYEPITVIEGKLLPTPGSGREREYVASADDKAPAGGVQRFKLALHGASVSIAAMVGYVQAETCEHWFFTVNRWVEELASSGNSLWSSHDRLERFELNSQARTSRSKSEHARQHSTSPQIYLAHFWVEM